MNDLRDCEKVINQSVANNISLFLRMYKVALHHQSTFAISYVEEEGVKCFKILLHFQFLPALLFHNNAKIIIILSTSRKCEDFNALKNKLGTDKYRRKGRKQER